MEESIARFCRSLASFSNHIESSSVALTQSLLRRPIPLDSASSTFVQSLNRKISKAGDELNLLESMSLGTVSFEELLGHCNEVYKSNQTQMLRVQENLRPFGYVPDSGVGDELLDYSYSEDVSEESKIVSSKLGGLSLDDDDLFDESLSLKNIGLSNVCLASLASEANSRTDDDLDLYIHEPSKDGSNDMKETDYRTSGLSKTRMHSDFDDVDGLEPNQVPCSSIKLIKDDYEVLPSYMKGLASWEDLLSAVDKINSRLNQETSGRNFFHQDEISSLGLGPKARSYLLLLVRLNRFKVETIEGLISYKVSCLRCGIGNNNLNVKCNWKKQARNSN